MCKQLISILIVLSFCVCPAMTMANIVWVGDTDDQDGDGTIDDLQWAAWLREQGYTVDDSERNWTTLDDAKLDILNQAELVIISRNTDSGDHFQGQEPAQWNSVTTPIILLTPYLSRSIRWGWVNHDGLNIVAGSPAWNIEVPEHPVFLGVDLGVNNQVNALDGDILPSAGIAHLSGDTGNGTVLAGATSGETAIVEWEPGIAFYDGGVNVTERRLLFCAGTTEAGGNPQGGFNLTEVGQQLFLNAVNYMLGRDLGAASGPMPVDDAQDVLRDAALSWVPGPVAVSHDVYFGTSMDDVSNADRANPLGVLVSQAQVENTFDLPGLLELGQTYYWRVDAVDPAPGSEIHRGGIWSFTVELFSYPIPADRITVTASSSSAATTGPENTINGSGLDENDGHSTTPEDMWLSSVGDSNPWLQYEFNSIQQLDKMWLWNYNSVAETSVGWGLNEVRIEYSVDGNTWTELAGVTELTQAPGVTGQAPTDEIDFGLVPAKYVRITILDNFNDFLEQFGLSEVRFYSVPVQAHTPDPASGAGDVPLGTVLTWRPGREAGAHEVYLGPDANNLALVATVSEPSYGPALNLEESYVWKVIEVNDAEDPAAWESDLWNFTVSDFVVIDDFESYTNDSPNRAFQTWIDGIGFTLPAPGHPGNETGMAVGHDIFTTGSPFFGGDIMETAQVRFGSQSMPLYYDGSETGVSETTRTFATAQDWTQGQATTLSLVISGSPGNDVGQLYVKVNDTQIDYSGGSEVFTRPVWTQWNIALADIGAEAQNVNSLTIGISGPGSGLLYVDDIRVYRTAPAVATEEVWIEAESADTISVPLEILSDNDEASGGRHIGVLAGNNSMEAPPTDGGIATYTFNVQGGTYRLLARTIVPTADDNSCWIRISSAETQTTNHPSGYVWWFDIAVGESWHLDELRSNNDDGQVVQFTLAPGEHTLEFAYREDGLLVDAFLLTDLLD